MKRYLIDEAERLEPSTGPWMVLVGDDRIGEDWLIASFGMETDGQNRHVTTDRVHASEVWGGATEDAEWVVWCRNHWGSIKEALDATRSPAGTDREKVEAAEMLRAWNSGEPIRPKDPDAEVIVLALQQEGDIS